MILQRRWSVPALAATLLAAACAAPEVEDGFAAVSSLTAERLVAPPVRRDDGEDAALAEALEELLAEPLTAGTAVRVALLENRELQATLARLGVARADVVQAGMLSNPGFSVSARWPDRSPRGTNLEFGLVHDLLDVLLRPARRDLARVAFEQVQLEVAAAVLELAVDVEVAFYEALGARQVADMRALVLEASEASAELARRMHAAGNISDLRLTHESLALEDARVAHALAVAEVVAARERLNMLMGLWRPGQLDWSLPPGLPDVPAESASEDELLSLALGNRLDLQARAREADVLAAALGLDRDWRWLPALEVGVSSEREPEGQIVAGPEVAVELPLFDRGEARRQRLAAQLAEARHHHDALAARIAAEVRAQVRRLEALRSLAAHHRAVVIPLREAQVAYAQQEYDYMLIGAFELISARQAEYDAYERYIETVRDAWIARVELDRALGGVRRDDTPGEPVLLPSATPRSAVGPRGAAPTFTCPMHPAVTAAAPGDCPECGMMLVPAGPPLMPTEAPAPDPEHEPAPDPHAGHDEHRGHGG